MTLVVQEYVLKLAYYLHLPVGLLQIPPWPLLEHLL
jgi:hypothetical protein